MNRIFTIAATVAALSTAAPAFANSQLARSLDVAPGAASTAQLVQLKNALEVDDRHTAEVIRDRIAGSDRAVTLSSQGRAASNADALALSLGVTPGVATTAELVQLKAAIDADDRHAAEVIRQRIGDGDSANLSTSGQPASGAASLARSLGVTPGTASTAELVQLKAALEADDRHTASVIRDRIAG